MSKREETSRASPRKGGCLEYKLQITKNEKDLVSTKRRPVYVAYDGPGLPPRPVYVSPRTDDPELPRSDDTVCLLWPPRPVYISPRPDDLEMPRPDDTVCLLWRYSSIELSGGFHTLDGVVCIYALRFLNGHLSPLSLSLSLSLPLSLSLC